MRLLTALLLGWFLAAGCSRQPASAGATPQIGLEATMGQPVLVFQEMRAQDDRILLIQEPHRPTPMAVLMTRNRWSRWQVGGWMISPLKDIGPVSFSQNPVGAVAEKLENGTVTWPEYLVMYGEVKDPRITWVEVTLLDQDGSGPTERAAVRNGTWLVWFSGQRREKSPDFALRGGSGDQELFTIPSAWEAGRDQ